MSGRGRGGRRGRGRGRGRGGSSSGRIAEITPQTTEIGQAFVMFQQYFDDVNDRRERVFKLSRDITMESKRAIFLLQRSNMETKEQLLKEAETLHFSKIRDGLRTVFQDLDTIDPKITLFVQNRLTAPPAPPPQDPIPAADGGGGNGEPTTTTEHHPDTLQEGPDATASPHQPDAPNPTQKDSQDGPTADAESEPRLFLGAGPDLGVSQPGKQTYYWRLWKAFTFAVQEMVEAALFAEWLRTGQLADRSTIQHRYLSFFDENDPSKVVFTFEISPEDYVLGVADLTGELMRFATQCVAMGDYVTPFDIVEVERKIYNKFRNLNLDHLKGEMEKKIGVMKASVEKVEKVCYALILRGSEVPKEFISGDLEEEEEMHAEGL